MNGLAREWVMWMADASLRALFLAALAALLVLFARRNSAAQHIIWTLVLLGMLALPFLRPVAPPRHVRLPKPLAQTIEIEAVRWGANPSAIPAPVSPATIEPAPPPLWPLFALTAYLAGVAFFATRLLAGAWWARRALRNSRRIASELWEYLDLTANIEVSLEESDRVQVPLTTGLTSTRVILPTDWVDWPAGKMKAVLAHELAHARPRDPLIAMLAAINKCVFWFHPLAWWLEGRLAVLAEHVGDDAGLMVIGDAESYAGLLLEGAARLANGGHRITGYSVSMSGR